MKGKCFIEPLFHAVVEGRKTMMREVMNPQPKSIIGTTPYGFDRKGDGCDYYSPIKPRYKEGEKVYLKEPFNHKETDWRVLYKYEETQIKDEKFWYNMITMPEDYARYFIEITDVKAEELQKISDEDCEKEGISFCAGWGNSIERVPLSQKHTLPDWIEVWYSIIETGDDKQYNTPQQAFAALMDKINDKRTWDNNPFVWTYEFKLI